VWHHGATDYRFKSGGPNISEAEVSKKTTNTATTKICEYIAPDKFCHIVVDVRLSPASEAHHATARQSHAIVDARVIEFCVDAFCDTFITWPVGPGDHFAHIAGARLHRLDIEHGASHFRAM